MDDDTKKEHVEPVVSRPLGVWLLTVYAVIVAGIVPLALAIFLLLSGQASEALQLLGNNMISLILSMALNCAVIFSAFRAWQGKNEGRKALIILIAIHYALLGLNSLLNMNSELIPPDQRTRMWGPVVRAFLYPAVYIWYFRREVTMSFYQSQPNQEQHFTVGTKNET